MSTTPIPQVRDDDPEDVSWALSTAATSYARGDRIEALKWLRRAAEAASEAEKDARALELAKAAAELTTPSMPPPSNAPPAVTPKAAPVGAAPAPAPSNPAPSKPVPPAPASSRPAPLSSRPAPLSSRPAPLSKPPAARPSTPAPRPAAGAPAKRASVKPPPTKPTLDLRARAKTATDEKTDTNIITEVTKLDKQPTLHAAEADAWPTESMGASELESLHDGEVYGQERTRIGSPAYKVPDPPPTQPPFRASQAVHVVIWRDADGTLRIAPRGTAVSAVRIEALLVAPSAEVDLLAWLTPS